MAARISSARRVAAGITLGAALLTGSIGGAAGQQDRHPPPSRSTAAARGRSGSSSVTPS
jgi:hypothetical protein